MKVFVKCSAIAADSFTMLPHGVVYINEDLEPRLAKRVAVLIQKFPEDICLYEGKEAGLDIKGSRNQELDAEAEAEAEKILAKAKAQKTNQSKKETPKQKPEESEPEDSDSEPESEDLPTEKPNAPKQSRAK